MSSVSKGSLAEPLAEAKRHLSALQAARGIVYSYEYLGSMGWGIYNVVYT